MKYSTRIYCLFTLTVYCLANKGCKEGPCSCTNGAMTCFHMYVSTHTLKTLWVLVVQHEQKHFTYNLSCTVAKVATHLKCEKALVLYVWSSRTAIQVAHRRNHFTTTTAYFAPAPKHMQYSTVLAWYVYYIWLHEDKSTGAWCENLQRTGKLMVLLLAPIVASQSELLSLAQENIHQGPISPVPR